MLAQIARFEFRYLLRNPLLWATAGCTFVVYFLAMARGGFLLGAEGGLLENASIATLRDYIMVSALYMFVTTSFVANAIIRDDETGFGPIIRSTSITRFEYLFGRFIGAFAVAALCLMLVTPAIWIGSTVSWADPATIGPNRLANHLYGYFLIGLPNLLIHGAVFFALATITRSMTATYLGVIGFLFGFFYLQGNFADRPLLERIAPLADPFGSRALNDATRYWTIADRNVLLPDFAGDLLYNRLIWIGIAVVSLAVAHATFRFAESGRRASRPPAPEDDARDARAPVALPFPNHGHAALRALLWMRTKFEMKQVFLSPAFPVLMVWGLSSTLFFLITQRHPPGRPTYPTTLSLIPRIESLFGEIPLMIACYYAGELVWRERDRRMHELVDAAPMPNWGYVVPKTLAMALVLMAALATTVVASIGVQLAHGYTQLELGRYLLWYVLPQTWDMLLLAALAMFIQALSPHKAVGWGVMVLFLMWQELNKSVVHNLLNFGAKPWVPLSDINGAGSFWRGAWTLRLYWGAFALLLLVAAHLLWRRGTELRLKPRLPRAGRGLLRAPGWVAAAALLAFIGTGAYAYYNTNILNEHRTKTAGDESKAELEKKFGKYAGLPQPSIANVTLDVALYPDDRRAVTEGRYLLRNLTPKPIAEIHTRLAADDLRLTNASIAGAKLVVDDPKHNYRIYKLARAMQPGEEVVMTFRTERWHRGFRNREPATRLVENGTFLTEDEFMPVFGLGPRQFLQDPVLRRRYGLPGDPRPAKLEDLEAALKPNLGDWTTSDITVSTSADQTPVAPGKKVSDVTRGGRRIARFVSEAPIAVGFSIQSARYAEKHRRHGSVDLAVYYHPTHAWNVDRMLDAMAASLDYYQASFGPYPFDHVRIVEFPGYGYYAQAFAGTIAYSEDLDFVSDFSDPATTDHVTSVTAHELAHQWWGHQVMPADMEGASLVAETLAQYSAFMVMKKLRGEEEIRRMLLWERNEYLQGRAYAMEEMPLVRVLSFNYVRHRKGAIVMYLLQKRMGEQTVNRALRTLIERYRFKGPPYPRSLDLIHALRAEAKTAEEQNLITDLFERITLYDLKVTGPTAVRRADGNWDVTVPVEAKKIYADGKGGETDAPLDERIEAGLFMAEPGGDAFDAKNVVLVEWQPIRSGRQVLTFVTATKPAFAAVDPYGFYIDRNNGDNVAAVK